MSHIPVAILGGGISGLAAAYELTLRNVPFQLFEKSNRLGGMIRTETLDKFTVDTGPDSLLVQKPAAMQLVDELGLSDRLIATERPRTAYVYRQGRLRPLPSSSVLGIPTQLGGLVTNELLSWQGRVRMLADLAISAKQNHSDESVADFFRRRFGHESVDYIAEPLLAGIHAGNVDKLSMQALFPRLVKAERDYGSVIKGLRHLYSADASERKRSGVFRSFSEGLETLTRELVKTIPTSAIHKHIEITAMSGHTPLQLHQGTNPVATADEVISTLPAHALGNLTATLSTELSSLCNAIPYTSIAIVVLGFLREAVAHPLHGSGLVVPRTEPNMTISAATWISSKWPQRAPHDHILLRAFVGGFRAPNALTQSDDDLIARALTDFQQLLSTSGNPVLAKVYRWPAANPQPHVGHLNHIKNIDRVLEDHPNLQIVGAAFRGVGIPDCIASARDAARRAAERYLRRQRPS